jgi:hypothetical protein
MPCSIFAAPQQPETRPYPAVKIASTMSSVDRAFSSAYLRTDVPIWAATGSSRRRRYAL